MYLEGFPFGKFQTHLKGIFIKVSNFISFSLTDKNIRAVIVSFSIHLPSLHTPKSSSDEPLWYL